MNYPGLDVMREKCNFLILRWACFREGYCQRRLFNFRSHSRWLDQQCRTVSMDIKWVEEGWAKAGVSVVCVKQQWRWNEGTYSSGLILIVVKKNRKIWEDKKCSHWAISTCLPPPPSKLNQFQFWKVNSWV